MELADAARHREKIKEAIKRNLPDIISDEAIITRSGDQIVRVPVRGIKSYRFIHKYSDGAKGGLAVGNRKRERLSGSVPNLAADSRAEREKSLERITWRPKSNLPSWWK